VACSSDGDKRADSGIDTTPASGTATDGSSSGGSASASQSASDTQSSDTNDSGSDTASNVPKYDVGGGGNYQCANKAAGVYCEEQMSIECGDSGDVIDTENCIPGACVEGTGCVTCLDGQYNCQGPRVMACNTAGADPTWEEVEVCDVTTNPPMACDVGMGTCVPLGDIGMTTPTGTYYKYSELDISVDGFSQVSDVDSWENRIYFVAMKNSVLTIGYYDVQLLDSDGDGVLEPNQHPDNPEEMGPMEERVFTYVGEFAVDNPAGLFPNVMEIYALDDRVYWSGISIQEKLLPNSPATQVAPGPSWGGGAFASISFLGYDDVNEVWYSGNEAARRVFQFDSETQQWGYAFQYPELAGSHMDGMEVVTDYKSGIPYVYVSDMTSDFIGQYRQDPENGWVQENLFSYTEPSGLLVEGFGYGALNHFWVGSLANHFYELGGGDLTQFIDPEG
jgi:hypothetical protein